MTLSITANAVLARLRANHTGRKRGITCAALAGSVGVREREARAAISELREDGHPVCGTPATGYFLAESPDELEATCEFLRGRALTSLKLESKLRGVPFSDLVGQMQLEWEGK